MRAAVILLCFVICYSAYGQTKPRKMIKGHTYCEWCGRDITKESKLFLSVKGKLYYFCDAKPYEGEPKTPEQIKDVEGHFIPHG